MGIRINLQKKNSLKKSFIKKTNLKVDIFTFVVHISKNVE